MAINTKKWCFSGTHNPLVVGSSPTRPTTNQEVRLISNLCFLFRHYLRRQSNSACKLNTIPIDDSYKFSHRIRK